jgi:hypothetical protein
MLTGPVYAELPIRARLPAIVIPNGLPTEFILTVSVNFNLVAPTAGRH